MTESERAKFNRLLAGMKNGIELSESKAEAEADDEAVYAVQAGILRGTMDAAIEHLEYLLDGGGNG